MARRSSEDPHLRHWRNSSRYEYFINPVPVPILDRAIVPAAAKSLRAKGVRIFAIGVGNAIESELREIASEPYENHVIFIQGGK